MPEERGVGGGRGEAGRVELLEPWRKQMYSWKSALRVGTSGQKFGGIIHAKMIS